MNTEVQQQPYSAEEMEEINAASRQAKPHEWLQLARERAWEDASYNYKRFENQPLAILKVRSAMSECVDRYARNFRGGEMPEKMIELYADYYVKCGSKAYDILRRSSGTGPASRLEWREWCRLESIVHAPADGSAK